MKDYYSCFVVVEVGLQQMMYTVDEGDGMLLTCVQINTGQLEREVVVNLTTADNTATSNG